MRLTTMIYGLSFQGLAVLAAWRLERIDLGVWACLAGVGVLLAHRAFDLAQPPEPKKPALHELIAETLAKRHG